MKCEWAESTLQDACSVFVVRKHTNRESSESITSQGINTRRKICARTSFFTSKENCGALSESTNQHDSNNAEARENFEEPMELFLIRI